MHEKTLEKISLIISIIGILIVLIISETYNLKTISISLIDESFIDKSVKVEGYITEVRSAKEIIVFNLKDSSDEIKVIIFDNYDLPLFKGQKISVIGKIQQYKGDLEIIADEVVVI